MAYFVADEKLQGYYVSGGVTINIVKYHFECDDAASLPAQTAFISSKKVKISMASTAHTIDTDALYKMDSSGAWVQQSQPWQPLADYSVLSNKPQINGHTLTGNQSGADLGLQNALTFDATPTQNSTNPVTSGGIWTDQKRQETEIGVVANAGAKNIFDIQAAATAQRTTTVLNPDGGVTISCNAALWATRNVIAEIPSGDYICSLFVDAVMIGGGTFAFFINQSDDQSTWTELARQTPITSISQIDKLITVTKKYLRITTNINNSDTSATNSATIRLMLRPAAITDTSYQPYARSNPALTAEMDYVVNAGAKNYCPKETETSTGSGFTADVEVNIPAGTYILSFTGTLAYTASFNAYRALPHSGNSLVSKNLLATTGAQSVEFTITEAAKYIAFYHNGNGNSLTNIMIRPAAITDPSFQPYAPTNRELYEMILALQ